MSALWALVPAPVRNILAWTGALLLAVGLAFVAGLRRGKNEERLDRLQDNIEARDRADAAATDYRSGGGASERLRKGEF